MAASLCRRAATACLMALGVMALAPLPTGAVERAPASRAVVLKGPDGPPSIVVEAEPKARLAPTATFRVSYTGFTAKARAAFQRAVDVWARKLASPVPITVAARFVPLPPLVLGQAGPGFVFRDFPGAAPNTWYVDALANGLAGRQLDPLPDIFAEFNSEFTAFHFGTGAAPRTGIDFTSVVLHELGHGLGFLGAGFVSGDRGTVRLSRTGRPLIFDRFTESGDGRSLVAAFPNNSPALAARLQNNALFFDSPRVRRINGDRRARLFAPSTFIPGSSYFHLSESEYPRGDRNSLMTPFIGGGETIRVPGPITQALLRTLGWAARP